MGIEFEVREEILEDMRRFVRESPTAEVPFAGIEDKEYNMLDVLREVQNRTELGKVFYEAWERLYEKNRTSDTGSQ